MAWYYIVFFVGGFSGLLMCGRRAEAFVHILMLITGWVLIIIFGTQFTAEAVLCNAMVDDLVSVMILSAAAVFGSVAMTFFFLKGVGRKANDPTDFGEPAISALGSYRSGGLKNHNMLRPDSYHEHSI